VGKGEVFYSAEEVKSEFIIPNNTWIRIGDNVQIEVVNLEDDVTEIALDSGVARFYNRSSATELTVATPYGKIVAPPETTFDTYLNEESVEVISLKGTVTFIHVSDRKQYEVISGSSSVVADYHKVTSGKGKGNEEWHAWNTRMDEKWDKRLAKKGNSEKYLPESLYYESHALDDHGIWEQVYYEGRYCNFWRPSYVSVGWSPFSVGRWSLWYGDHCWVPHEPFGYVTHHYGNWIYAKHCHRWYWAPPVRRVGIGIGPYLHIGVSWYPGRVSWIHRGSYIGWIPLAPFERYYTHRYWGPRSTLYSRRHRVKVNRHRYRNHAVIVNQKHFYDVDNYTGFRHRHIRKSFILDSYRPTPIINSRVIRNFKANKNRFKFGSVEPHRKPHRSAINKINYRRSHSRPFFNAKGTLTRAAHITSARRERRTLFKTPGVKKNAPRRTLKLSERKRSKKRQPAILAPVAKRRKSEPKVKALTARRVPGISVKPKRDRPRTLLKTGKRAPKSTFKSKNQRLFRKLTPGKKARSISSRPFTGKSQTRTTFRSNARRTTSQSRVRGSPRRSGLRMR
jgi:hypothetical protein